MTERYSEGSAPRCIQAFRAVVSGFGMLKLNSCFPAVFWLALTCLTTRAAFLTLFELGPSGCRLMFRTRRSPSRVVMFGFRATVPRIANSGDLAGCAGLPHGSACDVQCADGFARLADSWLQVLVEHLTKCWTFSDYNSAFHLWEMIQGVRK